MSVSVTAFSPQIFSVDKDVTFTVTGTNLGNNVVWINFRDVTVSSTVSPYQYHATSQTATSATFTIPKGALPVTIRQYQLFWGSSTNISTPPTQKGWASNTTRPHVTDIRVFQLSGAIGYTIPVGGGVKGFIGILNTPDNATASVKFIARQIRTKSWKSDTSDCSLDAQGTLQITNTQTFAGIIHFTTPKLAFEGLYDVSITLSYPDGTTSDSGSALMPGPGMTAYVPLLVSTQDIDKASDGTYIPSQVAIPAMGINCSFTVRAPAPGSLFDKNLLDTSDPNNIPQWVNDYDLSPDLLGSGDTFDWSDNQVSLYVDGVGHSLLDESPAPVTQLLELQGTGMIVNGSPVAFRVWVAGKGWRCARMAVTNLTYTQPGNYPTRWVVDSTSLEYPSRPEEIFGIYQLIRNPNWANDDTDRVNRRSPCFIETNPNEIMFGVDKVILVPGAFTKPVDPFFVFPTIPQVQLVNAVTPSQNLVYNDGGWVDGFKVDVNFYLVYFTGYLKYSLPTDAVAATATGSSPNAAENIGATCLGSGALISTDTTKYMLAVASEPKTTSRPCNIFYTIYSGTTLPSAPSAWKPLMNPFVASAVANGVGQVSVVSISPTSVLLFQRSRTEILQVYACTVNLAAKTLVPSNASSILTTGVLSLKSETVMASVAAMYQTRFGISASSNSDINLIYDSWFHVLYQPPSITNATGGYHVFAVPYTFASTVVHLWYSAAPSAPFIDETSGTCIGIYGSVPAPQIVTTPPTTTPLPVLQLMTGNMGSMVDLVVDAVNYSGAETIFIEIKAQKSATNVLTFSTREWGNYNAGFLHASGGNDSISTTQRSISLANGAGQLTLHWSPTSVPLSPATAIDPSMVIDGDIWILEVLPYSITGLSKGIPNSSDATLILDTSGSKLQANADFSCTFTLTYTTATGGGTGLLTVTNSKNTGPSGNANGLLVADDTTYTLSNSQVTISPSTADIVVTVKGTPKDQDKWQIAIVNGVVQQPTSGTRNTGTWGYPTIGGTYTTAGTSDVTLAFSSSTFFQGSLKTANFTYSIVDHSTAKPLSNGTIALNVVTKQNSAGVNEAVGWTTAVLSNGLTVGFDNIAGAPATNDTWTFTVTPATAVAEIFGQKPCSNFNSTSDKAWVFIPTRSAGGRILQFQAPLVPSATTTPNRPVNLSLLPIRTTLETYLASGSGGGSPTLVFKGLKTIGVTWSDAVKTEIPTDVDNQRSYGLIALRGQDFRPAHSGAFYTVSVPPSGLEGISQSAITALSTFASDDLLSEPRLPSTLLGQLPPIGWTFDPLSDSLPQFKPTAWLAVFPQYLFHIGQVHVVADCYFTFGKPTLSQCCSVLAARITDGSGFQPLNAQISKSYPGQFYSPFYINTMIPATDLNINTAVNAALGKALTQDVQDKYMSDTNDDGSSKAPFWNDDFQTVLFDETWATPDKYPMLAKYILQLGCLQSMCSVPPSWTFTKEGRICDNYWKFRIGELTCNKFLTTAIKTACYQNQLKSTQKAILPKYFSSDTLFVTTFGSVATAAATVLTEPRLQPSFAQLPDPSRAKLIDSMMQLVGSGGMQLFNACSSYLANQAVMSGLTPINSNAVSELPITTSTAADGTPLPPSSPHWAGPLMTVGIMSQLIVNFFGGLVKDGPAMKKISDALKSAVAANVRAPGSQGDRASLEARTDPRNLVGSDGEIVPSISSSAAQESQVQNAIYKLPDELKGSLRALKIKTVVKGADVAISAVIAISMISGTVQGWGQMDKFDKVLSISGDIIAVSAFAGSVVELSLRIRQLRALQSNASDLAEKALGVGKKLESLEKVTRVLGGLLNVVFGIESIYAGSKEVNSNTGKLTVNGRYDVAAGALMTAGGTIELLSLISAGLAETGVGTILAGIGFELSIIKVWVGGKDSVAQFGEPIAEFFGQDGGASQDDIMENLIVRIKDLALLTKVSQKVTTSHDPKDNGIESGARLIIAPLYDVSNIKDSDNS